MYHLPKMYESPIDIRFIVASKNYSTKPPSDLISEVFKININHVEIYPIHALKNFAL